MEGLFAVGSTLVFRGELQDARTTLERALALDHPERDRSNAFLTGQDVGVTTRSYLALALWQLGFPERALEVSREAIAEARRLSHPFSLISALASNSFLHQLRGEPEEVLRSAEEAITLSERLGFFWVAQGNVMMGWAEGMLAEPKETDEIDEATERIRGGVDAIRATGSRLSVPYCLSLLATIEERRGRPEAAREVLTQAFDVARETGEHLNEPDFFRLLGRIHHATEGADSTDARKAFDRALEVAHAQGARSLELRISLDRSRLLPGEAGQQGLAELAALLESDLEESPSLRAARELVG
jgi:tetratricopeptide (TPR) repeat protein